MSEEQTPKFCPFCASTEIKDAGDNVFVEAGEWNGKTYENEYDATKYECSACKNSFVI